MFEDFDDEDDDDAFDEDFGQPDKPVIRTVTRPMLLGRRQFSDEPGRNLQDTPDPLDLEPRDDLDDSGEVRYNPFAHCYALILDELNMEIVVGFKVEGDGFDFNSFDPIVFLDDLGRRQSLPFFPQKSVGLGPAIVPVIHRGKVFGDENKEDVLVTEDLVRECVPPQRLIAALEDFYKDVSNDMSAPAGLLCVLQDVLNPENRWRSSGGGLNFSGDTAGSDF